MKSSPQPSSTPPSESNEDFLSSNPLARDFRCIVAMYHYIRAEEPMALGDFGPHQQPQSSLTGAARPVGVRGLSPERFEEQIDGLCQRAEPIDWAGFQAALREGKSAPSRSFLLTFDDGLVEHAEYVAQTLGDRGIRGVFFVSGSTVDGGDLLPAHALHLLMQSADDEKLERLLRLDPAIDAHFSTWSQGSDAVSRQLYHYESPLRAKIKYILMAMSDPLGRNRLLSELTERLVGDSREWARRWYLSGKDVVALHHAGHTVGGHGYAHEALTRLTDADLTLDLQRSSAALSRWLGDAPRPMSYPYGRYDQRVMQSAAAARFCGGFTTESRWACPMEHPFAIPRVDAIAVERVWDEIG